MNAPPVAGPSAPSTVTREFTVLVVDDEAPQRAALRLLLEGEGITVREAEDGRVAVAILAEGGVDVVLTDLLMPEMEGLELIDSLRRSRQVRAIIAMSGGGRGLAQDYLKLARLIGANFILEKPFPHETLLGILDHLRRGG